MKLERHRLLRKAPWFGLLAASVLVLVLLIANRGVAQTAGTGARVTLSELVPIPLRSGVNQIERFAPDGRNALIILSWRENGNAHAYDLFLVLLPSRLGATDWNVVGVDFTMPDRQFEDTIRDAPHTGDDMVRSVRFVRGRLNGKPATLLLAATRELSDDGIPAPSLVNFDVFVLQQSQGDVGVTRDYFSQIARHRSTSMFCNAEVALSAQFALPIRRQRDWPNTPSGCP